MSNEFKGLLSDYDYSLVLNGKSKHLNTNKTYNENNEGAGIVAAKDNHFFTLGGYRNSYDRPSYYLGAGLKKRYGDDLYIEPGILAGVATGYTNKLTPMLLPSASIGLNGLGALNFMYAPKFQENPATIMMNLNIPFK